MSADILIVGCGDLGGTVASALSQDLAVVGLSRSAKSIANVQMIQADVTDPQSLQPLIALKPRVILYCVAAGGRTDAQYKAQYVDGLRNVLVTQQNNVQLSYVMFVSSTRVYGQPTDALLDESMPAVPTDFGGERLRQAELLLDALDCDTTVLRLSGIYGPGRLRMIKLAQQPDAWPEHNHWSNRIHRDDAAAFIQHLLGLHLSGQSVAPCYIVTDSQPTKQYDVITWIATKMGIEPPRDVPVLLGGKRLNNQKMLETGFKLQYADFKVGYQALLAQLD